MGARFVNEDVKALYESAGLVPPKDCKGFGSMNSELAGNLRKLYRIVDEQDAIGRYLWYNLPLDLSGRELERLLYYKGQLLFWYCKELQQFMITPYTLNEGLDFYGRYVYVTPVPIVDEANTLYKRQKALLSTYRIKVVYGVLLEEEIDENETYGVILRDYTNQLSETSIPRRILQEPLLDVMADMVPYMRTALLNSTGVSGMRVNNADEYSNVEAASRSVNDAALNGKKWVAITGNMEFQELTDGKGTNGGEPFMLALQTLDNLRKSMYGIESGGIYDKRSYVNKDQVAAGINPLPIGSPLQDGLSIRMDFCNSVNSIWGIGVWCSPTQLVMNGIVDTRTTVDGGNYNGGNDDGGNDDEQ